MDMGSNANALNLNTWSEVFMVFAFAFENIKNKVFAFDRFLYYHTKYLYLQLTLMIRLLTLS